MMQAIDGPFTTIVVNKRTIVLAVLLFFVLTQALAVVYAKHYKRVLHARLQMLQQDANKLQIEWSKLLLEQSTWQAEARVDKVAREQLGMVAPDKVGVIVP